jgi:hypothetical protein
MNKQAVMAELITQVVMPDLIRHPRLLVKASSGVAWIAGQARNDKCGWIAGQARNDEIL